MLIMGYQPLAVNTNSVILVLILILINLLAHIGLVRAAVAGVLPRSPRPRAFWIGAAQDSGFEDPVSASCALTTNSGTDE